MIEDLRNVGNDEAADQVEAIVKHLETMKSNQNEFIKKIETMDFIISDLTFQLGEVTAASDNANTTLRNSQEVSFTVTIYVYKLRSVITRLELKVACVSIHCKGKNHL